MKKLRFASILLVALLSACLSTSNNSIDGMRRASMAPIPAGLDSAYLAATVTLRTTGIEGMARVGTADATKPTVVILADPYSRGYYSGNYNGGMVVSTPVVVGGCGVGVCSAGSAGNTSNGSAGNTSGRKP